VNGNAKTTRFAGRLINEYGNVEVIGDVSLPKAYRFVRGKRLSQLCKKHGINFVPAVTGFDGDYRYGYRPVYGGVVVSRTAEPKLLALVAERDSPENLAKREAARQKREEAKHRRLMSAIADFDIEVADLPPAELIVRACRSHSGYSQNRFCFRSIRNAIIWHLRPFWELEKAKESISRQTGTAHALVERLLDAKVEEVVVAKYPWLNSEGEMEAHFRETPPVWDAVREERLRQTEERRKRYLARVDALPPGAMFKGVVNNDDGREFRRAARRHLQETRGLSLYHDRGHHYVLPHDETVAKLWDLFCRRDAAASTKLHDYLVEKGIPVPEVVKLACMEQKQHENTAA
jgi:hypothetical protein